MQQLHFLRVAAFADIPVRRPSLLASFREDHLALLPFLDLFLTFVPFISGA
jgi:hypothetical protein